MCQVELQGERPTFQMRTAISSGRQTGIEEAVPLFFSALVSLSACGPQSLRYPSATAVTMAMPNSNRYHTKIQVLRRSR